MGLHVNGEHAEVEVVYRNEGLHRGSATKGDESDVRRGVGRGSARDYGNDDKTKQGEVVDETGGEIDDDEEYINEESDDIAINEINDTIRDPINFAPRIRRRSSNFRPTHFYDPSTIKTSDGALNLEMLPMILITRIFNNVLTKDLLNICVTSRLLYLPAIFHLYRKIIIVADDNDDDRLVYSFIKQTIDNMDYNFGTISRRKNMPKLAAALKNHKLGSQVKQLVLINDKALTSQGDSSLRILMRLTKQMTSLTEFINPSLDLCHINRLNLNLVTKLAVVVKQSDKSLVSGRLNVPNVKSLTIFYENKHSNKVKIETFAKALLNSGVLNHLNELEFKEVTDMNLQLLNENNNNKPITSIWIDFFKTIYHSDIQPLKFGNLQKLRLDGFIDNQGIEVALIIDRTFLLQTLKLLELYVSEFSHLNEPHYENHNDLLINMALKCNSLDYLVITPTYNCLKCQLDLTLRSMEILKGQLTHLNVKFETLNFNHTKKILDTIIDTQSNVECLKVYDKSNAFNNQAEMIKYLASNYNEFERGNFNVDLFIQAYGCLLTFNQYNRLLHSTMDSFYTENHQQLGDYMDHYLERFNLSGTMILDRMRHLSHLSVNNVVMTNDGGDGSDRNGLEIMRAD